MFCGNARTKNQSLTRLLPCSYYQYSPIDTFGDLCNSLIYIAPK